MRYRVTAPKMKVRGFVAPKDTLLVDYNERTVRLPWRTVRPLIACAFVHVKREALRQHGPEYVRRQQRWPHVLRIGKSSRSWWGRACGYHAKVFIGNLHEEPVLQRYPRFKEMPEFWINNWREQLVGLTAHELWHRWSPAPNGKAQEYDCELVEWDAVDRWRSLNGNHEANR